MLLLTVLLRRPHKIEHKIEQSATPHPRTVFDLKGHGQAEAQFLKAWQSGRIHHAWIISGPSGIGKATLAYKIARFVLRDGQESAAALFADSTDLKDLYVPPDHPVSRRISSLGHPDLLVLEKAVLDSDGTLKNRQHIQVAEIRKTENLLRLKPSEGGWRVVIVDDAGALNHSAANALLKALEEPPPQVLFLLIAHRVGRLLPTIRSRCRLLKLKPLSSPLIDTHLQTLYPDLSKDAREAYINMAEGSLGQALAFKEADGLSIYQAMIAVFSAPRNAQKIHQFAETFGQKSAEARFLAFRYLFSWWWTRLIRHHIQGQFPAEILTGDQAIAASLWDKGDYLHWLDIFANMSETLQKTDAPSYLDRKQVIIHALLTFTKGGKIG